MNGEGSAAEGYIYQISNQITLGISEEQTVREVSSIAERIVEKERALRNSIDTATREDLTDRVMRSVGILTYATKISTSELISIYSQLRLGVSLGIVNIPYELLDGVMIECMPNNILADQAEIKSTVERDKIRATRIREKLGLKK
jgi:protein arginine kinase